MTLCPRRGWPLAAMPLLHLALLSPVLGQNNQPPVVTRVYDVTDLVVAVDPPADDERGFVPPTKLGPAWHPAGRGGGAGGGGGGGLFGGGGGGGRGEGRNQSEQEILDALVKQIQETVDPTSWRDAGGSVGGIRAFNMCLIVTQTVKQHMEIAQYLKMLRQRASRMVHIRATWALLKPDQLPAVLKAAPAGGAPEDPAKKPALCEVDPAALEKLTQSPKYAMEGTGLDGRMMRLTSGKARTVLTNISAVVGQDIAMYEPETPLVLGGAHLELTPVMIPDSTSVRLGIRACYGQWNKPEEPIVFPRPLASTRPAATRPATTRPATRPLPPDARMERVSMTVQSLDTVVRIPVEKTILVGALTLDGTEGPEQLCLFVRVKVDPEPEPKQP